MRRHTPPSSRKMESKDAYASPAHGLSVMRADLDASTSTSADVHEAQWRAGVNRQAQSDALSHQHVASRAAAAKRQASAMTGEVKAAADRANADRRNAAKRAKRASGKQPEQRVVSAPADDFSWHPGARWHEISPDEPQHPMRLEYEALLCGDFAAAVEQKIMLERRNSVCGKVPQYYQDMLRELAALGAHWRRCNVNRCESEFCRCPAGPRGWLSVEPSERPMPRPLYPGVTKVDNEEEEEAASSGSEDSDDDARSDSSLLQERVDAWMCDAAAQDDRYTREQQAASAPPPPPPPPPPSGATSAEQAEGWLAQHPLADYGSRPGEWQPAGGDHDVWGAPPSDHVPSDDEDSVLPAPSPPVHHSPTEVPAQQAASRSNSTCQFLPSEQERMCAHTAHMPSGEAKHHRSLAPAEVRGADGSVVMVAFDPEGELLSSPTITPRTSRGDPAMPCSARRATATAVSSTGGSRITCIG